MTSPVLFPSKPRVLCQVLGNAGLSSFGLVRSLATATGRIARCVPRVRARKRV